MMEKYKKYKGKPKSAREILRKISGKNNTLFAHWKVGISPKAGL